MTKLELKLTSEVLIQVSLEGFFYGQMRTFCTIMDTSVSVPARNRVCFWQYNLLFFYSLIRLLQRWVQEDLKIYCI